MKWIISSLAALGMLTASPGQDGGAPLQVCATIPDFGNLAQEIGGDQVSVNVFAKGATDPHFIEAKPSFIKTLSTADLYIQVGMELELGWAPVLLKNCRNANVQPGAAGFLDVSETITPLDVPQAPVDRSMGDVHPLGNPHYMLDPVNGIKAASLIRDRLAQLRPAKKDYFADRYDAFLKRIGKAMVGEKLASKYDVVKLATLMAHGKLVEFLKTQNDEALLSGWFADLAGAPGTKVVGDHNLWAYFAQRFGLKVVGFLEPKPGVSPSTRHLGQVIKLIQSEGVKVILSAVYFDVKHAEFVSEKTGAKVLLMAHQVGSRTGTDDYISMVDYNVRQLKEALGK
jgi:ABC-type Zn uptake system ZnuABC Zn-binding protein ZnuA